MKTVDEIDLVGNYCGTCGIKLCHKETLLSNVRLQLKVCVIEDIKELAETIPTVPCPHCGLIVCAEDNSEESLKWRWKLAKIEYIKKKFNISDEFMKEVDDIG